MLLWLLLGRLLLLVLLRLCMNITGGTLQTMTGTVQSVVHALTTALATHFLGMSRVCAHQAHCSHTATALQCIPCTWHCAATAGPERSRLYRLYITACKTQRDSVSSSNIPHVCLRLQFV